MNKLFVFATIFFIMISSCKNSTKINIETQTPLERIFAEFDSIFTDEEKNILKNDADEQMIDYHMTTGLWLRNKWLRGHNPDTVLIDYMLAFGLKSPDDISAVILQAYHRRLNDKKFDLLKLSEPYKIYWENIKLKNEKFKKIALENYNKYEIGDKLSILMLVDTSDDDRNAVLTEEWKFDKTKDLRIDGILIKKYHINSKSNVFFQILIKKMNFPNTQILMKDVKIGDTISLSLDMLYIE